MPPPLSSAIIQQIEDDLISPTTLLLSSLGADGARGGGEDVLQSTTRRYTFEVEREILARDAERRWNAESSSTSSTSSLVHSGKNDNNDDGNEAKGGPVDAPADHDEEEVEVDSSGCPILLSNASSSCGEFLRWKK